MARQPDRDCRIPSNFLCNDRTLLNFFLRDLNGTPMSILAEGSPERELEAVLNAL
ncbi:MAG: hypothetical protein WD492_09345 [Alkalispirochaeta sp.]